MLRFTRSEMVKIRKNPAAKETPATVAMDLVKRFTMAVDEQHHENRSQAERNLVAGYGDVRRNLPSTFALVFDSQHQHGQAVEGETPDDAEGVGLAEQVDVAVADQNGK